MIDPKIKADRVQMGSFFKQRREELGRSQKELADFLGIAVNTLQRVEAGQFPWDIDLHLLICQALDIKPYFSVTNGPLAERVESSDLLRIWLDKRPALALKTLAEEAGIPWTVLHDLQRGRNLPEKHWPVLEPILQKYGWE